MTVITSNLREIILVLESQANILEAAQGVVPLSGVFKITPLTEQDQSSILRLADQIVAKCGDQYGFTIPPKYAPISKSNPEDCVFLTPTGLRKMVDTLVVMESLAQGKAI